MKVLAVHDGSLFEETYNLLNAWLSIVPGNGAHNLRRLALLETNARGPELPVHARRRRRASAHTCGREALAVFETPHRHAVRLQPARAGRRTHARARRDRAAARASC